MLNSASAAAFISGRSVGAARRGLPGAAARKEKNGLHRAPLLKSPLCRRGRVRGGGNGAGRRDQRRAGLGAVTRRGRRCARSQSRDSGGLLTPAPRPRPSPIAPAGTRGAGRGRACAARRGAGRVGREARSLLGVAHPGKLEAAGPPRPVTRAPAWLSFPCPAQWGGAGRGRSQPRHLCD